MPGIGIGRKELEAFVPLFWMLVPSLPGAGLELPASVPVTERGSGELFSEFEAVVRIGHVPLRLQIRLPDPAEARLGSRSLSGLRGVWSEKVRVSLFQYLQLHLTGSSVLVGRKHAASAARVLAEAVPGGSAWKDMESRTWREFEAWVRGSGYAEAFGAGRSDAWRTVVWVHLDEVMRKFPVPRDDLVRLVDEYYLKRVLES